MYYQYSTDGDIGIGIDVGDWIRSKCIYIVINRRRRRRCWRHCDLILDIVVCLTF